jgi:DNA invertase Pin-like site-specific DNA recombinase
MLSLGGERPVAIDHKTRFARKAGSSPGWGPRSVPHPWKWNGPLSSSGSSVVAGRWPSQRLVPKGDAVSPVRSEHPVRSGGVELGYARVSTVKQDLDRQIDALEQVGIPRDRIYVDRKSGATTDRPGLRAVIAYAREGDVIVVHTLDRLGRTVRDTLNLIHELAERKIGVRNLADPIKVDSSNPEDPMAQLAVVLLALFGQMERTYTMERAAHARAVATAKGRRVGRPVLVDPGKLEWAAHLRDTGSTIAGVIEKTGIPRTSLYRHLPPRPEPAITADGGPAVDRDAES